MIPEDQKNRIVASGLEFMKAITGAYGTDKGMELYDRIVEVLDPSIKGAIFFAMLTGEYDNKLSLRVGPNLNDKIMAIKALRICTGMGLKEAKETVEKLRDHPWHFHEITVTAPNSRERFRKDLIAAGFIC